MPSVQVRPEINALTKPQSYSLRFAAKDTLGYDELAAEVVQMHPNYAQEDAKTIIMAAMEQIGANLIKGNQVVLPDAFTFHLSFTARLESPDDPMPPVEEMLNVRAHASRSLTETVQQDVQIERLPMTEKAPLITAAEDTVLGLNDVLYSGGALQLTGSNMLFDPKREDEGCTITGTRSGSQKQSRFAALANSEVTVLPDIPAQDDPWNNEYLLTLAARYTEHGTLRTSTYRRRLRTPLTVPGLGLPSITVEATANDFNGGVVSADETLRIQALLNIHENQLDFSLLDMENNGQEGDAVGVTANGEYILPGFSGSAVSTLEITVSNYEALLNMIRNAYSGRLVDVLEVKMA